MQDPCLEGDLVYLLDSACSQHTKGSARGVLKQHVASQPWVVQTANGTAYSELEVTAVVPGCGKLRFIKLDDSPDLLSISQLVKDGFHFDWGPTGPRLFNPAGKPIPITMVDGMPAICQSAMAAMTHAFYQDLDELDRYFEHVLEQTEGPEALRLHRVGRQRKLEAHPDYIKGVTPDAFTPEQLAPPEPTPEVAAARAQLAAAQATLAKLEAQEGPRVRGGTGAAPAGSFLSAGTEAVGRSPPIGPGDPDGPSHGGHRHGGAGGRLPKARLPRHRRSGQAGRNRVKHGHVALAALPDTPAHDR